jgi:hypothetical protein
VSKKIANTDDENKVKLNKMCLYLFKEWKEQLEGKNAKKH